MAVGDARALDVHKRETLLSLSVSRRCSFACFQVMWWRGFPALAPCGCLFLLSWSYKKAHHMAFNSSCGGASVACPHACQAYFVAQPDLAFPRQAHCELTDPRHSRAFYFNRCSTPSCSEELQGNRRSELRDVFRNRDRVMNSSRSALDELLCHRSRVLLEDLGRNIRRVALKLSPSELIE